MFAFIKSQRKHGLGILFVFALTPSVYIAIKANYNEV